MKLNKPKYHLFKNTRYALDGLKDVIQNETSFRLQMVAFIIFSIIAFSLQIEKVYQYILFISLFLNLLAEIVNSAIERVVDLCTQEIHPLAKRAKDLGASIVMVSIIVTLLIWISVLNIALKLV